MPTRYVYGGIEFANKAMVKLHLTKIRYSHHEGTLLTPRSSPEFDFLYDLASNHERFSEKSQGGIIAFLVRANPVYHTKEICIVDSAGNAVDISLSKHCITGKTSTPRQRLIQAMRGALHESSCSMKQVNTSQCSACKQRTKCEIDHVSPTFSDMVADFLAKMPPPNEFKEVDNQAWTFRQEDSMFRQAWVSYHDAHAQLQPLCHDCHRAKTSKDATTRHRTHPDSA
jgi:5-methylcytosine-specific restriction endonuclease McrA